jgi:hypothetical protein
VNPRTLARLKRDAKRLHITHDRIAAAAGVHRTLVVNVFARRATSANVVGTVQRLIAEAQGT